jgi:hypothetical protein
MNARSTLLITAPVEIGRTIERKIRHSLAPSTLAASMTSSGTPEKKANIKIGVSGSQLAAKIRPTAAELLRMCRTPARG